MIVMKYPGPLSALVETKQTKEDRHPNGADRDRAKQFKISPEEFIRRDNIVREMYLDCDFKVGDVCVPGNPISLDMYGKCTIKRLARTYHDFSTSDSMAWPKDDRPLIVEAAPEKSPDNAALICCTPKFLQRYYGSAC